mmetsp:Transcript_31434/g.38612  ORF Transcript_31434/g.38612 Transcript_31434/m.38612 type:complete len:142 (-) Transcript_31434:50-475(-)
MSCVRLVFLLCLMSAADAVRPMQAEHEADQGNATLACIAGFGKCCTPKCNGQHKWVKYMLTYTDCKAVEGKFINPNTGKPMSPGRFMLSYDDLPTQYGDYVCKEICQSEGYGPKQEIKVYRAGGDPGEPPICGFPMGGIKS